MYEYSITFGKSGTGRDHEKEEPTELFGQRFSDRVTAALHRPFISLSLFCTLVGMTMPRTTQDRCDIDR